MLGTKPLSGAVPARSGAGLPQRSVVLRREWRNPAGLTDCREGAPGLCRVPLFLADRAEVACHRTRKAGQVRSNGADQVRLAADQHRRRWSRQVGHVGVALADDGVVDRRRGMGEAKAENIDAAAPWSAVPEMVLLLTVRPL